MNGFVSGFLQTGRGSRFLLVVLLLSACSTAGHAKKVSPPPLPPTPVLAPAGTYTAGQNGIPHGMYLLAELWSDSDGYSSNGTCPGAGMIDFPMYGMDGNGLESFVEPMGNAPSGSWADGDISTAIGFFGDGYSNSGDMGGGASSKLVVIDGLPFKLADSYITIFSAAADGTIVVGIHSQVYRLKPGERWVTYSKYQADENCLRIDSTVFRNYGLVDGSRITISGTSLAPGPTATP